MNEHYRYITGAPSNTRVPQPCILIIIHKHVPFVGKCSNSEMHSWASRVIEIT